MDENIDVVIGHKFASVSNWGGIAILENTGLGFFQLKDSLYFENGYPDVHKNFFDNNVYIDIFSRTVTIDPYTINITVIYNYGLSQFDSIKSFSIYPEPPVPFITSGDVDGDGFADLLFAHNNDYLWGIIYNDGTGNFSAPEYYDLDFPPTDIKCADLNDDGRSDIVVTGSTTEIYFSYETGFVQQLLTETLNLHVLLSDFDNDYDNDIILHTTYYANHHRVYLFENLGNNQFFEHDYFEFTPFCRYAQIADFNNDSLPDMVFIAHDHSGLYIYYNQDDFQLGEQQFVEIYEDDAFLQRVTFEDFDNNSFNDIALIINFWGTTPSKLKILFNNGNGGFQEDPITNIKKPTINEDSEVTYYPNPFYSEINIKYNIKESSFVEISVFSFSGELIRVLTSKQKKGGDHLIKWDGLNNGGKASKPDPYLLTFKVNDKTL